MTGTGKDASEQDDLGARIREGMARRRMSRLQLADAAKLSVSTLEKGLSGERPFSIATLIRIEDAIGIRLRAASSAPGKKAAEELGAYRREGVEWLTGTYLTLRPGFEKPDTINAYLTEISWNEEAGHLAFSEKQRADSHFAQKGAVSMPFQSGYIYLVTNELGQYRLMILGRPSIAGNMYGLLSTLRSARGGRLTPVAAPIALLRWDMERKGAPELGQIGADSAAYAEYRREIDRICEEEFIALIA